MLRGIVLVVLMAVLGTFSRGALSQTCDTQWWPMAAGMDKTVYALTVYDDDADGPAPLALYAGGSFNTVGGIPLNHLAKWDGIAWSALTDELNDTVYALTVFDQDANDLVPPKLYAGGSFTKAGNLDARMVAGWDGATWSALADGLSGPVYTLAVYDDGSGPALYVGGNFTKADTLDVNNIAKWDGAAWSDLNGGMNDRVNALTVYDAGDGPALYAGGHFNQAGGIPAAQIAKWDGATWSPLAGSVLTPFPQDGAYAPESHQDSETNDDITSDNLLQDTALDGPVWTLTVHDDGSGPALYVGGEFTTTGGIAARKIAKWDGAAWSALADGLNGTVHALSVFDEDGTGPALYAGGWFTASNRLNTFFIARWDGMAFSALNNGMNNHVRALAIFDDDGDGPIPAGLYAGGGFTTAGGLPSERIAKWSAPPELMILTQPANQAVALGDDAEFSVIASGYGNLQYQWTKDGPPLQDGGNIFGAETATLTISPVTAADAGDYYVTVSDTCATLESDWASLSIEGDCNGNGVPDDEDIANCPTEPWCGDCDGNGVPDECEYATTDCDDNGLADECEITLHPALDCNTNGVLDVCDLANCPNELWCDDCNANGVLDDCEKDTDYDGVIDECDGCPRNPFKTEPDECGCGLLAWLPMTAVGLCGLKLRTRRNGIEE